MPSEGRHKEALLGLPGSIGNDALAFAVTASRTTLVLGGQRSGKSRYAEGLVAASGLRLGYVATATAGDAEMADRIARHRARRGPAWSLIEEPLDLSGAITHAAQADAAVLVDCLTLWVSNLIGCHRIVTAETDRLLQALGRTAGRVVIVSNEVGLGIIPANALSRQFADDLGTLNQRIAAAVDEVVLMAAGLPMVLKQARAGE